MSIQNEGRTDLRRLITPTLDQAIADYRASSLDYERQRVVYESSRMGRHAKQAARDAALVKRDDADCTYQQLRKAERTLRSLLDEARLTRIAANELEGQIREATKDGRDKVMEVARRLQTKLSEHEAITESARKIQQEAAALVNTEISIALTPPPTDPFDVHILRRLAGDRREKAVSEAGKAKAELEAAELIGRGIDSAFQDSCFYYESAAKTLIEAALNACVEEDAQSASPGEKSVTEGNDAL